MDQHRAGRPDQPLEKAPGTSGRLGHFDEGALRFPLQLESVLRRGLVEVKVHKPVRPSAPRKLLRDLGIGNDQELQLGEFDLVDHLVEVFLDQLPRSVHVGHRLPFNPPPTVPRCISAVRHGSAPAPCEPHPACSPSPARSGPVSTSSRTAGKRDSATDPEVA